MSVRRYVRPGLIAGALIGLLPIGGSCYRAEIDLAPLMDDESRAGRGEPAAGGGGEPQSAEGGESGSGGAGSATPNCDMTPLDAVQSACRLSPPSDEMCEAQDTDSWSGCYAGGCTVCTEMVAEYPYYFKWNACCKPNATCSNHDPRKCNQRCPAPSQRDKVPPCFVLEPL